MTTMRNLDLIARTEDVHFGLDASVGLGVATPAFGSDRNSVLADTEINYGWQLRRHAAVVSEQPPGLALRGRRAA